MLVKSIVGIMLAVALAALHQSQADQLPVRPKTLPNIIIRPHVPIRILPHPIVRHTTVASMTTPNMVDSQNWTFIKPSDVAKDCIQALGKSLVTECQSKAESDWDPVKLNTSTSTTWETCCSLFDELDCYVRNAYTFCPASTQKAVITYSRKVAYYFHSSICQSISFLGWKHSCDNATHTANAQRHNKTIDNNPNLKPKFVNLPPDDGPEKACFIKLRQSPNGNLENKCMNSSLTKWDPNRRKFMESAIVESCCAIYDSLNCIEAAGKAVCSGSELKDMDNYKKKSLTAFQAVICKNIKFSVCKSSGNGVLPSMLTLITTFFLFVRVYI